MSEEKFYAGFWVRLFAGLLDIVFLAPILFILVYFSGNHHLETIKISDHFHHYSYLGASSESKFIDLITYAVSIAYLGYFISSKKQATFGKRVMGIYVGNRDGSKLSGAKSFARAFASMITSATLGLGFFLVIFTKEKTALHDLLCNTRVFHGKK
jgi:uncharacterized RDD family membrane protein YckC